MLYYKYVAYELQGEIAREPIHLLVCIPTVTKITHIKTHGSESQGQEEATYIRIFWPTQPLQ